ncbi:glycoside hydrolase family 76 protein [Hyaloscypha variabilis F]|uniref:mannan endo-1,6-alpha-mannosidase n=1 Tax=Hyaloscypha variabilis (strain UAMH 11265 / GT02V1 / F) TaxID=1149755 RepID=A0A2J6QUY3_HYAVF|nr:glycoside hydrolase family 76 protein [Hyaloscypha variabilis F]
MLLPTPRLLSVLFSVVALCNALPQPRSGFHQIGSRLSRREDTLQAAYSSYADAGIKEMLTFYNSGLGLFGNTDAGTFTPDWWNSANVITMLADYEAYFPGRNPEVLTVFSNTLAVAVSPYSPRGSFLNTFYDDELWWVLAWIKVYDVTGDVTYLNKAAEIYEDPKSVWNTTPCSGGIWWDFAKTAVNAIANELFFTASVKLANRIPSNSEYFPMAMEAYNWFIASGMINSKDIINDGLNFQVSPCVNNGAEGWTYNQGVILSGLAELTWSTGDPKYNDLANTLATASMAHYANNSALILHEPCEPNCDSDLSQFKGIYGRNIQFLVNRADILPADLKSHFIEFLQNNANDIWANDKGVNNQLGLVWSGEANVVATVETQSSALDAIVGAAAVS